MYDPTLGTWVQQDPEGYVDGASLYEYVENNPVESLDPQGLDSILWGQQKPPVGDFEYTYQLEDVNIVGQDGNSTDRAWFTLKYDAAGFFLTGQPGVNVSFDLHVCPLDDRLIKWTQTVQIFMDNSLAVNGQTAHDLQQIWSGETKEHGGDNPFLGPVNDLAGNFVPNPFQDSPSLFASWYGGLTSTAGIGITKSFQTEAYYDGIDTGISVNWHFHGIAAVPPKGGGGGPGTASVWGTIDW